MKKQFLALLLAVVMIASLPLSASAEWVLDCSGWWTAHSEGVLVTETAQSWTFQSTTYETATNNWNAPIVVVYGGNGYVGGDGYVEEMVIRSDNYAWGDGCYQYSGVGNNWDGLLDELKAGVTCNVTAQKVGDKVVVGISVGKDTPNVTSIWIAPVENPDAPLYLSFSGELCTLTGLQAGGAGVDISGAVASLSSEGDDSAWTVDCSAGFLAAKSSPLSLTTEAQTWTFTSTTDADAVNNWDAAIIEVYGADWLATLRSDNYGWGSLETFSAEGLPADWSAWLNDNKAGVTCTVTAQVVDGIDADYVVIGISNNGLTTVYKVPMTGALDTASLILSGENCVLTELATSTDHIDLSAAVASIPVEPEETEPEATEPEETEPEATEPVIDETPAEWVVDCPAWWGGHTPAVKVSETRQSWSFTNTTYESAVDNWDTATVVVWRSDDGVMMGSGYLEELLVRSDSFAVSEEYFWGSAGQDSVNTKNYPADWAAWLEGNKAGAECTITTQIVNSHIIVGFTNNGVTNVYCVPMNLASTGDVYLSVTGEECTLTNWHATANHIDISQAVTYAENADPSDPGNASTGDSSMIGFMVIIMISSFAALVVLTKRRFA